MIDLENEALFPLAEAADHYPRRNGKKPSFCTVWRHGTRGSHGVVLETVRLPSGLFTSEGAIRRFIEALTAAHAAEPIPVAISASAPRGPNPRRPDQRERDISAAEQRLAAAGIK